MKRLWAPWRSRYILGAKEKDCLLCRIWREEQDADNLVLWRSGPALAMLNRYPYNTGHLMVVPRRHERHLENLSEEEMRELFSLTQRSLKVLKEALQPHGFNLGINLGEVAGAGVEDHLHLHIVPRWRGDTNFMPVTAATKVVSQALQETFATLRSAFQKMPS